MFRVNVTNSCAAVVSDEVSLTVNPLSVTLKANNKSKTYGDNNPALDATVTGTVNGDVLNYTLATTATQFSNVGDYPITVTLGANPNYSVTTTDATLNVTPKTASVTPIVSGKNHTGILILHSQGRLQASWKQIMLYDATYTRTAGETVNGSPYHNQCNIESNSRY